MQHFMKALLACCFSAMVVKTGTAQPAIPPPHERPDLWTVVQDSFVVSLFNGVDTTPANQISGAYTFSMLYDSTCRTEYIFTEPWLNRQRLTLDRWVNDRAVNADQDILSFNSRTKPFRAKAGDTVRFYREMHWINPVTSRQDTTNYLSRDTLGFSVELVRTYDMGRIILLDSLGILPQLTPGKIRFHSPHNSMAVVEYVLPEWVDSDSLCMRVRVYARGSGEYYFTRYDNIKTGYSNSAINHPVLQNDMRLLQSCCWTPISLPEAEEPLEKAILRAGEAAKSGASILSVRQIGDAGVTITTSPPENFGIFSIIVVDGKGKRLPSPFSSSVEGMQEVSYQFPSSGAYFIGLVHNGKIIETTRITITR